MASDPQTKTAQVVFTPSGRRGDFPIGTTVLDAARSLGVYVESACGGRAICGRCQVRQSEGEFAKLKISSQAEHLSKFTDVEADFAEQEGLRLDRRLGCQAKVLGDVVIDIPADSQMHSQIVRKRAETKRLPVDPAIRMFHVKVQEPDIHQPMGDLERILQALKDQHGVTVIGADYVLLTRLQKVLREANWDVTVTVFMDGYEPPRIMGIWRGKFDRIMGLAYDIGSTTIACNLVDLNRGRTLASAGIMNPQIRFGEDLMSRVSYIMMNPGGDEQMTEAVREAIVSLADQVVSEVGANREDIVDAVFVGNPVMHHLLLGIDPIELGGAPFALATSTAQTLMASDLGLSIHPNARAYTLPCIAGHVGADAAAVALAEKPYLADETVLVVDVGTNAEILLGNKERLLACSSPTGPAFEGAELTSGQRAAPGAIERVRIDPETLEPRFSVIGCDLWSDEPGFDEATAVTGVTGICGSGIVEAIAEMYLAGIINEDGIINGALAERQPKIQSEGRTFSYILRHGVPTVRITQTDVRAIQLAKAALHAGVKLLMDKLEITAVDRVKLAGAFGSHIDVKYAMILGLIPDCTLENVASVGNCAGTGAKMALLDKKARREIEQVVRQIEKIETAVEADFQQHFVEAMAIPHKTDAYAKLRAEVKMPERGAVSEQEGEAAGGGRRRRRRDRGTLRAAV